MREKRKQKEQFIPGITKPNKPPSWRAKGQKRAHNLQEDSMSLKKQKMTEVEINHIAEELQKQFYVALSENIKKQLKTKKDNADIKSDMKKRVPRGTLAVVEQKLKLDSGTIYNTFKKRENNTSDLWGEYVDLHFDEEVQQSKNNTAESSNSKQKKNTAKPSSSKVKDEVLEEEDDISDNIDRTCSVNLKRIIRKDIPDDINNHIWNTISTTIVESSNYIINFNLTVLKMFTLLQKNTFIKAEGKIKLVERKGPNARSILPSYLFSDNDDHFLAPYFNKNIYIDKNDKMSFEYLLSNQNLQHIHSHYFGSVGVKAETKAKFPFFTALTDKLPKQSGLNHGTDSYTMQTKLNQYLINFRNLWDNKDRFRKLLDQLVKDLLEVNLRHKSTKARIDKANNNHENKSKKPTVKKPSRGKKRRVRKNEYTKIAKLQNLDDFLDSQLEKGILNKVLLQKKQEEVKTKLGKAWTRLGRLIEEFDKKGEEMEEDMTPVLQQDNDNDSDCEMEDESDEVSNSRLRDLKTIIKDNLLHPSEYNEGTKYATLSQSESQTVKKIVDFLHNYLPEKENMLKPIYQIPFILMANKLTHLMKCKHHNMKWIPRIKLNTVHKLRIDSPMIFSLFSSSDLRKPMDFYDYDDNIITTRSIASEKKAAIMGSVFDLDNIHAICKSYHMTFGNIITYGINSKRISIHGCKLKNKTKQSAKIAIPLKMEKPRAEVVDEIKKKTSVYLAERKELDKQLNSLNKERRLSHHEYNIRSYKNRWISKTVHIKREYKKIKKNRKSNKHKHIEIEGELTEVQIRQNTETFHQIENIKKSRKKTLDKIALVKKRIADNKKNINEIQYRMNVDVYGTNNSKFVERISDAPLNWDRLFKNQVMLSGTDNGLVKMTVATQMTFKRYLFHLYCYINSSEDQTILCEELKDSIFLKMPESRAISSKSVKYFTGGYRRECHLIKTKNKALRDHENRCSNIDIFNQSSIDQISASYNTHIENREISRDFYYSTKQVKLKEHYLFLNKWAKAHICAKERDFISKENPICMFIGDRGYCVGSTIKGYVKYGGTWKALEHSKHVPVYITNEHNTSQTCLFCFGKLDHVVLVKDGVYKRNNGIFICPNSKCLGNSAGSNLYTRDVISAMAIVISGLSFEIFGLPLPVFDPQPSINKEKLFKEKAKKFLAEHEFR